MYENLDRSDALVIRNFRRGSRSRGWHWYVRVRAVGEVRRFAELSKGRWWLSDGGDSAVSVLISKDLRRLLRGDLKCAKGVVNQTWVINL